jgi:hypothetical protein
MSDLIPVDLDRCQAETVPRPIDRLMALGVPPNRRCERKPRWIAYHGGGSMSLCEEHARKCKLQVPDATFQRIKGRRG